MKARPEIGSALIVLLLCIGLFAPFVAKATATSTPTATATATGTIAPTPTPSITPTPTIGPVAAYSFNEGSGTTVTDASGHGITGIVQSATWTPGGMYGGALSFNGSSSFVDLGNPALLQITGSLTLSAWVKATANPADDGQIIAKSDSASGWQLKTSPDTGPHTFGARVSGGVGAHAKRYSTTVRSLNEWYHVASVYDAASSTLNFYVNGALDNGVLIGTIPSSQVDSTVNVNIGRRSGGFHFSGVIDEVRIYNRALSQMDIQADMSTPIEAPSPTATATATGTPTPTPTPTPGASPAYPLKASANGRYLVDQNDLPFLMVGHDAQGLIGVLSHADSDFFFANRKAAGFNSFWIDLLCYRCAGNGSTTDGIPPFTTPGDIATPNEEYFARVDDRVRLAEQYGLNVVLNPAETIGTLQLLRNNGPVKDRAYGQYLGNRYQNFNNIIWMSGNDFQTWSDPYDDAVVQAVALGIKDIDTRHIHTVELHYSSSDSLDDPTWAPIISLNAAYTYYPTYYQVLIAYNRSNFIPVFLVEGIYEFGNNSGNSGTPDVLRKQEYWAMLSGANAGQEYGNRHMSGYTSFEDGWQNWLDTPGATQIGYLRSFFEARAWYDLVPDQTHAVVTSVTGGFSECDGLGTFAGNDCTTAASTSDGRLAIAYVPINATLTVNMAQLSGDITARWFDPSNNTYRSIAGSPFPNSGSLQFDHPGNNSEGFTDWLLVLESLTTPTPTPTVSPPPTVTISGTVIYCSNPGLNPVPGVTLTLTGSAGGSTLSDGSGNYTFASLLSGGSYTVTPSKATLIPGSVGSVINTVDLIAVQRHFLILGTPLSGCRLTAADVDGLNGVNTVDAVAVQRFFLGLSTGIANVGNYQFTPANRSYSPLVVSQTGQNYDTVIFGDVAASYVH